MLKKNTTQIKSKQRVSDHGEVFTNTREVNAMLDLVKEETERIEARFLEPACWTWNFLVEVLSRKLNIVSEKFSKSQSDWEKYVIIAVSNIYGVELLGDNVKECRKRLQSLFETQYAKLYGADCKKECRDTVSFLLSRNIIWGNFLDYQSNQDWEPEIIFSEWVVDKEVIQRKDFLLRHLLDSKNESKKKIMGEQWAAESVAMPIKEFQPVKFLELYKQKGD